MGSAADTSTVDRRRRRVLFFPLPYQGHINPMFQLAGILHARGFAVTIFHARRFNAPDASLHPAYDFVPVPDDVTPADSPDTVQTTLDHILAMNRACEAPFRDRLAALLERARAEDDDVACLVADAHLLTLLGVARGLGVPTLALRIGSAACFRWFMAFPMLCDKGYLPAQGTRRHAHTSSITMSEGGHAVILISVGWQTRRSWTRRWSSCRRTASATCRPSEAPPRMASCERCFPGR
jgi:hypothetical protein